MITILIADDHKMVRDGLKFFLNGCEDIEVIGEAADGREAVKLTASLQPGLVLLDVKMPVMDGLEAARAIKASSADTKIIILSSFDDKPEALSAVEAGVDGYQLKNIEPDVLAQAIRDVAGGLTSMHPAITTHMMQSMREPASALVPLTNREHEVLMELADGRSNKEIADLLFISEKTVKSHVSNLLSKLEVHDRTQAALYAVRNGLSRK